MHQNPTLLSFSSSRVTDVNTRLTEQYKKLQHIISHADANFPLIARENYASPETANTWFAEYYGNLLSSLHTLRTWQDDTLQYKTKLQRFSYSVQSRLHEFDTLRNAILGENGLGTGARENALVLLEDLRQNTVDTCKQIDNCYGSLTPLPRPPLVSAKPISRQEALTFYKTVEPEFKSLRNVLSPGVFSWPEHTYDEIKSPCNAAQYFYHHYANALNGLSKISYHNGSIKKDLTDFQTRLSPHMDIFDKLRDQLRQPSSEILLNQEEVEKALACLSRLEAETTLMCERIDATLKPKRTR